MSSKIYRTSDIIPMKVDGLRIGISPLTFDQKMEIQAEILKGDAQGPMRAAALSVMYSVKQLSGMKMLDGSDYELEFDEDGHLTKECWDDLCNLQEQAKLTALCLNLVNGMPKEFIDHNTGEPLEGVSIIRQKEKTGKKS